jgi:hypothetical protein
MSTTKEIFLVVCDICDASCEVSLLITDTGFEEVAPGTRDYLYDTEFADIPDGWKVSLENATCPTCIKKRMN